MSEEATTVSLNEFILPLAISVIAGLFALYYIIQILSGPKKLLPLDDFQPFPLLEKKQLSHDTCQFVFGIGENKILGLPTGQHLSLKFTKDGKAVQRSYTPVSSTLGSVTFVIKVYRPNDKFPNGGAMSQYLDALKIGDTVLMKGPKGHVEYMGNGTFKVKPLGKPLETRTCSTIGMIAGGTGITPMLQIAKAIFRNPSDNKTKVKLLYANQTPDDILVKQELEELQREYPDRFQLWYTVDRPTKDWKFSEGFINTNMVKEHCHFGDSNTQFILCGPPPMLKFACIPALQELGYSEKNWVSM